SHDLPLAFPGAEDTALTSAADAARKAIDDYATELETKVLPVATDAFAIGTPAVEARYRAEELIETPAASLVVIGERELAKMRAEFDAAAGRVKPAAP